VKVIDSSIWLEYFAGGPLARKLERLLEPRAELVTPAVVVYEVYRWLRRHRDEDAAAFGVGLLQQTTVVPVDAHLAVLAAELALEHALAMADALVYATAVEYPAPLVTTDADFAELRGVEYHPKT
jgi:predicted nucleic acid-binding protein